MATYYIKYTSMECFRESNEPSFDDEAYALFVSCDWKDYPNKAPRVKVGRTKVYTNVDAGEKKGTHDTSDDVRLWGISAGYEPIDNILKTLILVQAMEHDYGSAEGIRKSLEITMKSRLKKLLKKGVSRDTIRARMKQQMTATIDETKGLNLKTFTADFFNLLQRYMETGDVYYVIGEYLVEKTISVSKADDRVGGVKQFVLYRSTLDSALVHGKVRKKITWDDWSDGKYQYKFSIFGKR